MVDRYWQNVRRCAGYKVQYFAALEPQARLPPHLHAAMRGVIPRAVLRQVVEATYVQVWWPAHDRPIYVQRQPTWTGDGYCDRDTGAMLPTWAETLDQLQADPKARPAHVMRFGRQYDMAGIIAPSPDADRAVRYLAKYLTKAVADPLGDWDTTPAREAHIDRLHAELRWLPCTPRCANWLRYGIQPDQPGTGLVAGRCASKAHDREHLGCGGRRVLVSRDWSGKTLAKHKADRATVVREALDAAGMLTPDVERMAAGVLSPDGLPGSSGPMTIPPRPPTPSCFSGPSLSDNAGGPSTTRPGRRLGLWTTVRQPAPTCPTWRLPTARPHPMTRQDQGRRTGSHG